MSTTRRMVQRKSNQPRTATRVAVDRRLSPGIEAFEPRQMLDGASGFIAGTAFIDSSGNGILDPTEAYLPGATVQLFQASSTTPLATTLTDAVGGYLFTGLKPGDYVVVETPPAGFVSSNAQAESQLSNAAKLSANSIKVTIPSDAPIHLNYTGVLAGQYEVLNNRVEGVDQVDAAGSLKASLGTAPGSTNLSSTFYTLCLNDLTRVTFGGGESFVVSPKPITSLVNPQGAVSAERAGRIAFLYNHFGETALSSTQGAALQLAVWELLYDTGPTADFSAGNFQSLGPVAPTDAAAFTQVIAQATDYFNQSQGKSESAYFLEATGASTDGYQSMIATYALNFANVPATEPLSSLSGFVYVDLNNNGHIESGEPPIPGTTVKLSGTDSTGASVLLQTVTDTSGAYSFTNLKAGTYTITEIQPAGFDQGKVTQGTPGTGTVIGDTIATISLAAGVNGIQNNFGERLPAPLLSSLSGFVYVDANNNGIKEAGEAPIPGTTITLSGTDESGASVLLQTVTDTTGAYAFTGLKAGTYNVVETQPAGYEQGKVTQGTPGTGTVVGDAFIAIKLAAGVNGVENNFGEVLGEVGCDEISTTGLELQGIHNQQRRVILTLNGAATPASAQNVNNYTLVAIGGDGKLGTADDRVIPISKAVYDSSKGTVTLFPAPFNIHYNYVLRSVLTNDCGQTSTSFNVFGRSSMQVWDYHGRTVPAPKLSPSQMARHEQVVTNANTVLKQDPGVIDRVALRSARIAARTLRMTKRG